MRLFILISFSFISNFSYCLKSSGFIFVYKGLGGATNDIESSIFTSNLKFNPFNWVGDLPKIEHHAFTHSKFDLEFIDINFINAAYTLFKDSIPDIYSTNNYSLGSFNIYYFYNDKLVVKKSLKGKIESINFFNKIIRILKIKNNKSEKNIIYFQKLIANIEQLKIREPIILDSCLINKKFPLDINFELYKLLNNSEIPDLIIEKFDSLNNHFFSKILLSNIIEQKVYQYSNSYFVSSRFKFDEKDSIFFNIEFNLEGELSNCSRYPKNAKNYIQLIPIELVYSKFPHLKTCEYKILISGQAQKLVYQFKVKDKFNSWGFQEVDAIENEVVAIY